MRRIAILAAPFLLSACMGSGSSGPQAGFTAPPPHVAFTDAALIRQWAGRCLKTVPLDQRLRLIGVKMAALVPGDGAESPQADALPHSLPLFDLPDPVLPARA